MNIETMEGRTLFSVTVSEVAPGYLQFDGDSEADEINIETDDALHARYLERIPVVAVDGEELSEYFVDEEALIGRILYREGR